MAAQRDFDVVVVNNELESACAELVALLGGNRAGHGVIAPQYPDPHSQETVFREHSHDSTLAAVPDRASDVGAYDTPLGITNPPIDDLLDQVTSKYALVIYAAKRARQINDYYTQLGEGLLEYVGPLVEPGPREKPLSIALREIQAGLLEHTEGASSPAGAGLSGVVTEACRPPRVLRRCRRRDRRVQGVRAAPAADRDRPRVRVLPTASALEFVGAATFEALSGQPVHTGVFARRRRRSRTCSSARRPTSWSSPRRRPTCWRAPRPGAPTICSPPRC